jgi:uncharacterized membrane protein YeaQ/YmgE (transglycosylase-associated protein family)
MNDLTELLLSPGGIVSWVSVGAVIGWLAGAVMDRGGFGIAADIGLGVVGAVAGGLAAGLFIEGASFLGMLVVAAVGACALVGISRAIAPWRAPRL